MIKGPLLRYLGNRTWQLEEAYASPVDPNFWVEAGFKTNLASVPPALRPWADDDDQGFLQASIHHDWLYTKGNEDSRYVTRADADLLFARTLVKLGVPKWKASLAWAALRCFGKEAYKKC